LAIKRESKGAGDRLQFSWEDLKNDPELLKNAVKKYGVRGLAEKVDIKHPTVIYHLNKLDDRPELENHGHNQRKYLAGNLEDEKEAAEDERLKIKEFDDGSYTIKHPSKGTFLTTDDELNELRFYYCQLGLTQDETTNKLKKIFGKDSFNYDKFKILKRAFHIVHGSRPLQERTIDNGNNQELAKQVLNREEKEFDAVFREERIKKLESENRKLREKRYISNRVIDKLGPQVKAMRYSPPEFNFKTSESKCDYLLLPCDWHTGKQIEADNILGLKENYNYNVLQSRVEKYLKKIIYGIKRDNPGKVTTADLGDTADGKDIYKKQAQNQELYGYKQCVKAADLTEYLLAGLHKINPNLEYLRVPGNHSKNDDSDLLIGELVKRGMKNYESIKFDISDNQYKARIIRGMNHVFTHGENIRTGTYTRAKDVLSIIQLLKLNARYTYVHQGHLHHWAKEGARHNHWLWPSIVGGDELGNNIMQEGARASQIFLRLIDDGIDGIIPVYFD